MNMIVEFDVLIITSFFFFILGVMTVILYDYIKSKLNKENKNKGIIDFIKFLIKKLKYSKISKDKDK